MLPGRLLYRRDPQLRERVYGQVNKTVAVHRTGILEQRTGKDQRLYFWQKEKLSRSQALSPQLYPQLPALWVAVPSSSGLPRDTASRLWLVGRRDSHTWVFHPAVHLTAQSNNLGWVKKPWGISSRKLNKPTVCSRVLGEINFTEWDSCRDYCFIWRRNRFLSKYTEETYKRMSIAKHCQTWTIFKTPETNIDHCGRGEWPR